MSAKNTIAGSLPLIVLSAIVAGLLFLTLAPNIEENRLEARIGHTYRTVCKIAKTEIPDDTTPVVETKDTDPWGQPYRVMTTREGLIVMSTGPNQSTLNSGFDNDDIYSTMTSSPIKSIHNAKRRQLLFALSIPVIWLLGSIAYLIINTRTEISPAQNAG